MRVHLTVICIPDAREKRTAGALSPFFDAIRQFQTSFGEKNAR